MNRHVANFMSRKDRTNRLRQWMERRGVYVESVGETSSTIRLVGGAAGTRPIYTSLWLHITDTAAWTALAFCIGYWLGHR